MILDESEPSSHHPPSSSPSPSPSPPPPQPQPSPPPPILNQTFHSHDSSDSIHRSYQALDAPESECLPRQHHHVHRQKLVDGAQIKSEWKTPVDSGSPHKSLCNHDATTLVNGLCSYCGENMSLRWRISRNLFKCLCGIIVLLYGTSL